MNKMMIDSAINSLGLDQPQGVRAFISVFRSKGVFSRTKAMKKIPLTQGKFAIVDDEDYNLVSKYPWSLDSPKHAHTSYAICTMYTGRINNKSIMCRMKLHQLIMRPPKDIHIDHINRNGLDCRRSNMRYCTHSENCMNRRPHYTDSRTKTKRPTSSYKGVSKLKSGRWQARIYFENKIYSLGAFENEKEAALAYNKKAIEIYGKYAYLNEI